MSNTVRVVTVQDVAKIISLHGFNQFILDLVSYLKQDFTRWNEFDKSPRHAVHVDGGVLELMPVADKENYTYKYVTGHPKNTLTGLQTVVATGQLSTVDSGYPLMYSEMTILTALRTAATAIIAGDLLSRKNSSVIAIVGTGAQSEFQVRAHCLIRDIKEVRYYDNDLLAMKKFANNMESFGLKLIACNNAQEAVQGSDIIVVCTACKGHVNVIQNDWVVPGMYISGLGGDCPGKTELDVNILFRSKVVVEYKPQSIIEGEIQLLSPTDIDKIVHGELWELITKQKAGRISDDEITVFDSVGFALEDYSVLRLTYALATKYGIGCDMDLIPQITDPKNLISSLN